MIESYGEYFTESGVAYMERIQKMQIALTKKLSDALCIKPEEINEGINPIFTWTANWTNVWTNRKTEDMLVLVNNATRFVVAVYQVKKKDLKNIEKIIIDAIEHTLEDEDTVFYDNTEMMEGKVLKDYLYKDRKLCYRYDFGDGWEHEVKILKVLDD